MNTENKMKDIESLKGMTVEQVIMELFGRCVDTYVKDNPDDTFITVGLKVIDITYELQIPKDEAKSLENIYDAGIQLIELFGASHLSGQANRIKNQGMEITEITPLTKEDAKAKVLQ